MNLWSRKCFFSNLSSIWWSMLSKKPFMSPSINHLIPFQYLIEASAEWHPLSGLNPWELLWNLGSRTCSSIALNTSWIILSLGDAIPKGLILPLALGIYTLRVGLNWNCSLLSWSEIFSNQSLEIPSRVSKSAPGVIFPGSDLIFIYAV